jgi:hypothetical protein
MSGYAGVVLYFNIQGYMHDLADTLTAAVENVRTRFQGLSEQEAGTPLRNGGWSRKQVIGHLIDSASNNHQRFVRLLLEPQVSLPGYEQAGWVASQQYQDRSWPELLELWAAYNRHLAHLISCVPSAVLSHTCRVGAAEAVTLEFLMRDYVRHLQHHLTSL